MPASPSRAEPADLGFRPRRRALPLGDRIAERRRGLLALVEERGWPVGRDMIRDCAAQLGVTERTVYRDLDALAADRPSHCGATP